MALPNSIDASAPAGGDSPSLGDDQFRALKTFIEDIFSIPDATSITNAGIDYQTDGTIRYPRRQEWGKGADIASATAVTVGLDGNYFDLTGVANITSFSSVQAGAIQIFQFDDACTTTHNATSMILAGLASQTWAAGDVLALISEGGGNWRELWRKGPLAGRTLTVTTQISTPSIITASGALTITPAAGSNLDVVLSTTGDFVVNTDDLVVDTSAGRVGIGTASPATTLETVGVIRSTQALDSAFFQLVTSDGTPYTWTQYIVTGDSFVIRDTTAGADRLTIDTSGNVQVNTTGAVFSPDASDSAALGSTTLPWSDLFLASGAVINFNSGDVTVTHSANALDIDGGVVDFGSVPTVNGSAIARAADHLGFFAATTSAQLAGVISDETGSGALVFATAPTLSTGALVTMGTGSGTATVVGVANVNTTSQATTGTSKETLASYSLPANSLSANGKAVRVRAWGITAANGNSKTFGIDFGASTVATIVEGTGDGTAHNVFVEAVIVRTGSNTQEAFGFGIQSRDGVAGTGVVTTRTTPSATDSGAITIAVFGTTPTASGDLTFKGMTVEFLN